MICPQCGLEYDEGILECKDCGMALAAIAPEGPEGTDLDTLLRSSFRDPIAIGLAKCLLAEAGIPYFVMDANVAARQESGNFFGWWTIRVPHEKEAEAREILRAVEASKDAGV